MQTLTHSTAISDGYWPSRQYPLAHGYRPVQNFAPPGAALRSSMVEAVPWSSLIPAAVLKRTRRANMDDDELNAFIERLIEQYMALLHGWARKCLGNDEDARDMVQVTFLKAYLHLRRHPEEVIRSPKAWLFAVLRSALMDFYHPNPPGVIIDILDDFQPDAPIDPESQTWETKIELRLIIEDAIAELPEPYRTVARLRYIEGLSEPEICASFPGVPKATVHCWIRRARERLYKILKRHLEEGED